LACGGVAAAVSSRRWVFLLGLVIPALLLRDAWAWLAASPQEREAFRETTAWTGGAPDQKVIGASWDGWTLLALIGWLAGSIALVWRHPAFLVSVMFAASFLAVTLLDRLRAALGSRRGK
jgi:hypothetical protein